MQQLDAAAYSEVALSASFRHSSSYKGTECWNNVTALNRDTSVVIAGHRGFCFFTSYSYIPCHKVKVYWSFHTDRRDIKHTGTHEMQQLSSSFQLPPLHSPTVSARLKGLQFYWKTKQENETRRKETTKKLLLWICSRRVSEQFSTTPENILKKKKKKWSMATEKKNPGWKHVEHALKDLELLMRPYLPLSMRLRSVLWLSKGNPSTFHWIWSFFFKIISTFPTFSAIFTTRENCFLLLLLVTLRPTI